MKEVDIHEGIDNTLLILQHRLQAKLDQPAIQIIKEYGPLPLVECYAGQLNQVFVNLLANAIEALHDQRGPRAIAIRTSVGYAEEEKSPIFNLRQWPGYDRGSVPAGVRPLFHDETHREGHWSGAVNQLPDCGRKTPRTVEVCFSSR
jgi:phosphoglycerate-specific signal transduction histidine kinase